jgi:hypothetical protein
MMRGAIPPEDRHRPEPEIIPPGQPEPDRRSGATWTGLHIDDAGVHRFSVMRVGPLGMLGLWAIVALGSLALTIIFLGALVLLIPLIVLLVSAGIVMSFLGSSSRRRL